nr:hypothetical protein [uncultured Chryseobacterium sp.]
MKKINIYFNKEFSSTFIIFFRIAVGLLVFIHFLSYWKDFELLYTDKSIIPVELHSLHQSYNIVTIDDILNFFTKYFSEDVSVGIFKYFYIILCIFIVTGFFSRISALLLMFLQVSFIKYASLLYYGADFFTTMSLFYVFLFPTSSYFSIQKKYFQKSLYFLPDQSLTFSKRLIQIHLCIAYFFSGFDKIIGYNWWNGEAVWKAMHLPNFNSFIVMSDYITSPIFYIVMGWGTIIIELLYPLFINLNKTRKLWFTLTILMHIGIIVSFNLFFFSAIMITWNLTAYYFNYYEKSDLKIPSVNPVSTVKS